MERLYYNFRIAPEMVWFIVTVVAGTFLVDIGGRILGLDAWPTLDTWQAWVATASLAAVRAGVGALLAMITGGGFQRPGEPAVNEPAPETGTNG